MQTHVINQQNKNQNMGKKKTDQERVAEFIAANPGANKAAIAEGTGVKGIILHNIIKKMVSTGELSEEGIGKETAYTAAEPSAEQTLIDTSTEPEIPVEEEQLSVRKGRNTQKYKFKPFGSNETLELGKGRLVLAVIRSYVEEKNCSLKQVLEVFGSTDLLKRFAPCAEIEVARERSGARDRYLFNDADQIILKDKKILVVSNQWTSETIQPVLKLFKSLGYRIK
jgi:hypothetical protein